MKFWQYFLRWFHDWKSFLIRQTRWKQIFNCSENENSSCSKAVSVISNEHKQFTPNQKTDRICLKSNKTELKLFLNAVIYFKTASFCTAFFLITTNSIVALQRCVTPIYSWRTHSSHFCKTK